MTGGLTDHSAPTTTDHVEAVRREVKARGNLSFVEVEHLLAERGVPVEGRLRMYKGDPAVVVWAGVSDEFAQVVREIVDNNEIVLWPTSPLTYMIDGKYLALPVAKRPPKDGYKTDHWAPCVISVVTPAIRKRLVEVHDAGRTASP